MAKQYEKKTMKTQQNRGLSVVLLSFMTFVFGYLAASWFDVNQFSHWVGAHFQTTQAKQVAPISSIETALAHPKLEFYTLLANDSTTHVSSEVKTSDMVPTIATQYKTGQALASAQPMNLEVSSGTVNQTVGAPIESAHAPIIAKTEAPKTVLPSPVTRSVGAYSVQVGSFRVLREAQRMKAGLMMKGFSVNIITVNQQAVYWYRVMIGPFDSLPRVQQARVDFARTEHISGMIRKLDA